MAESIVTRGISRRQAIKAAAATGAVVYALPIVDSVVSRASAASVVLCSPPFTCGQTPVTCGPAGSTCLCTPNQAGVGICGNDFTCGATHSCTTDAECQNLGFEFCQSGAGCCGAGVCVPRCGDTRFAGGTGSRNSHT